MAEFNKVLAGICLVDAANQHRAAFGATTSMLYSREALKNSGSGRVHHSIPERNRRMAAT